MYNLKKSFYSVTFSLILNFLMGIAILYIIRFWLPSGNISKYDPTFLIVSACIFIFAGVLPALSYNIIHFRMVKSGELNYGMFRYTLSTLTFIAPMLIYHIAWLRGFRLK